MAQQAAESARQLAVQHLTLRVPWSEPPFPANPAGSAAFEGICRDARRNRLARAMTMTGASTIAFAHHADDQVETSIMRMASGSGKVGASGMRFVRRWGMGEREDNGLTWMGAQGMNRYIVRPLLGVSKDRILATCEANGLQYVTDPTNSQPDITVRNYIRNVLREESNLAQSSQKQDNPSPFAHKTSAIRDVIQSLRSSPYDTGPSKLHDAVRRIGEYVQQVDSRVSNFLSQNLIPSPPTTLLFPMTSLQSLQDDDQIALIRRILRHVSPQPWGHISAEASGSHRALQQIAQRVRTPRVQASFTMGAKVWWRPVYIRGPNNSKVGFGISSRSNGGGGWAWLAQRERPWAAKRLDQIGRGDPLEKDVTAQLRVALNERKSCSVLYDCRVLLRFDMAACSRNVVEALQSDANTTIRVTHSTPYHLPQVVLRKPYQPDEILATYSWPSEELRGTWAPKTPVLHAAWIQMSEVRTWDPW
ncbi:hypothetical protein EIP91_000838 [Steccherinum ochraceum]|uniref:tRNA(Ile)-lysidine synthetase n=1 Tax=Steccherinum ochraceum TaxID=92696 RepID=A0A4R0RUR2_9APHY|nr:hypothetical protein EIP91_000838 [Steccherinum ochraceum]